MNKELFKYQLGWHKLNESKVERSYDFESFAAGFTIAMLICMSIIFFVF